MCALCWAVMSAKPSSRSLALDALGALIVGVLVGWFAATRDDSFSWSIFGPYFAGGLVAASVLWAAAEVSRVFDRDEEQ